MTAYAHEIALSRDDVRDLEYFNFITLAPTTIWNDIYSWPKEHVEYEEQLRQAPDSPLDPPCNSLWIIMREHNCSLEEAAVRCLEKVLQYEKKSTIMAEELLRNPDTSRGVRQMVKAYTWLIPGLAMWHCGNLRYEVDCPEAETIARVLSKPPLNVDIDQKFEKECQNIFEACQALERQALG